MCAVACETSSKFLVFFNHDNIVHVSCLLPLCVFHLYRNPKEDEETTTDLQNVLDLEFIVLHSFQKYFRLDQLSNNFVKTEPTDVSFNNQFINRFSCC